MLYDEGMKAKSFILIISSSMFAAQSLAICSKTPETYAQTGNHYSESSLSGTQSISAYGSHDFQSTDTCADVVGYENSDGLAIPWKPHVANKFQIAPIETIHNTTGVTITVNWTLVSGLGHNSWVGESSGKNYKRERFKDQYNVVQNPD